MTFESLGGILSKRRNVGGTFHGTTKLEARTAESAEFGETVSEYEQGGDVLGRGWPRWVSVEGYPS